MFELQNGQKLRRQHCYPILLGFLFRAEMTWGKESAKKSSNEKEVRRTNRLRPEMLRTGEMLSCQRRRSGFAFLMLTTRAGWVNSVGIGGRRW